MIPTLPVSEAVPKLREMLNLGGDASIIVGDEERSLIFNPLFHCPMKRLPWPLSKLQQQGCRIEVSAASTTLAQLHSPDFKLIRVHEYNYRSQHNGAIATFLQGAAQDDLVYLQMTD